MATHPNPQQAAETVQALAQRVVQNVEHVVVGKTQAVMTAIAALLAESHVLIEDAPGVAKTVLVKSLGISLGLTFRRVQCTPDLLPTDATGMSVFNQKTTEFEFRPGPVFANLLLVDELNRATPRTQSALLECMAEGQVTADNVTYPLEKPFLVFATQNPFEYEGTFPLPEAQLDRFALRMRIGYPAEADEVALLERIRQRHPMEDLQSVSTAAEVREAQQLVREIHVAEEVRRYIARVVRASRAHQDVAIGASPRATIALFRLAQAVAATTGQSFVTPDVVRYLVPLVLEHRLTLRPEARIRERRPEHMVADILERIAAPTPGASMGTAPPNEKT